MASIGAHFGEEPALSGNRGSGAIFLSGCSCGCFFCQNWQLSTGLVGTAYGLADLLTAAEALIAQGVHNVNFVTPDHHWPILEALGRALRERGHTLPFVFNGSGYHRAELVPRYAELIDIFLPDFKFADPELARHCMGDPRYPDIALAALAAMVEAKGFLEPWDPSGADPAQRGVLVRHLVLPGHIDQSLAALETLRRAFGSWLPLSVMSQYHPVPACREQGVFNRRLHDEEYRRVCDKVADLGFRQVYLQAGRGEEAFLPDFARRQPFKGNRDHAVD